MLMSTRLTVCSRTRMANEYDSETEDIFCGFCHIKFCACLSSCAAFSCCDYRRHHVIFPSPPHFSYQHFLFERYSTWLPAATPNSATAFVPDMQKSLWMGNRYFSVSVFVLWPFELFCLNPQHHTYLFCFPVDLQSNFSDKRNVEPRCWIRGCK